MGKNTKANKNNKKHNKTNKKLKVEDDNEVEENVTDSIKGQDNDEPNSKNVTEEENEESQYLQRAVAKKSKNNSKAKDKKGTENKKIADINKPEEIKTEIINPEKRRHMNNDEADVKDEDIDKFCDELDDEANVQYENWVKLIEANFSSNKKKKT